MCRLCRHQAIVYFDLSSPFSQLYGTVCLDMADLSHRCWCLADDTPEINDWYEPIEGACQGYLNLPFSFVRESCRV